jgi:hypothetical protein
MVYIKNLLKNVIVKKIQVHLQVLLLFKNIGYNVFKKRHSIHIRTL